MGIGIREVALASDVLNAHEIGFDRAPAIICCRNSGGYGGRFLSIVLVLFTIWQWSDAGERARPFWPDAVLSLTIGAAGPLAYLIHRTLREERKVPAAA